VNKPSYRAAARHHNFASTAAAEPRAGVSIDVALLTGGGDRPYAYGMATALMSKGIHLDLIAGDDLDGPEFHGSPAVTFFNLRGNQRTDASALAKISRVIRYYLRLLAYAAMAKPRIFHILWNNKFDLFDRTLLMLYYKLLGKRVVLTVHNVNTRRRDGTDTPLNRLTLAVQYRLADHLFVHTEKMKRELIEDFAVRTSAVTVVPFGINNAVPHTALTSGEAKRRLGVSDAEKTILFFGVIAPYKGLEHLIGAFEQVAAKRRDYRLVVAGRPRKDAEDYWNATHHRINTSLDPERIIMRIEHVPDEETELYFKAADVIVLPYTRIFQSGVLFLAHSFGLPAIVADIGSLKEDIVEGRTGLSCAPGDPADLARAIEAYFASDLFANLSHCRQHIRDHALKHHSWDTVSSITVDVYARWARRPESDTCSQVLTRGA
jgi:glycosyltransferase involved in cell wall biosynthesis